MKIKLQLTSEYQEFIFSNLQNFMPLEKVSSFFLQMDIDFKTKYFFSVVSVPIKSIYIMIFTEFITQTNELV